MEKRSRKLCWIRILKNASYIIGPILCALIILSFISISYSAERETIKGNKSYYETIDFANNYYDSLQKYVQQVKNTDIEQNNIYQSGYWYYSSYTTESKIETDISNINNNLEVDIELNDALQIDDEYYSSSTIEDEIGTDIRRICYSYNQSNFGFLIIDNKNKIAYTNVNKRFDTSTTDEIKEYLLNNNNFLKYEDKKLDTSIKELLNNSNIKSFLKEINSQQEEFSVYTAILDDLPYHDEYFSNYWRYYIMEKLYSSAIYVIPIAFILLMIMIPIVLNGIGRTSRNENIYLNSLDKLSIEIPIMISGILGLIGLWIIFAIGIKSDLVIAIPIVIVGVLICYMACIMTFETIVKRIKTHTFIKTTFVYWIYTQLKIMLDNIKITIKVGLVFIIFAIVNLLGYIILLEEGIIGFGILAILYILTALYIFKVMLDFEKVRKTLEGMYRGNTNIRINENELKGDLKKIAIYINDIAGGFTNAVEEKIKSEKFKTELITNVSHDIKTPLTSIINYIDLLKKDGITDEKAEEYLAILDNKSQRLKKLTEDLVEASKASSGNIKFNMEKLEVNELIKQVSGEFEDKFKTRGLDEIITFSEENVYIKADSRYMYRVLENIYSNVSKYALENTRVYTDIIEHGNNVIIQIKNVSKEKLNINADELMQRFVRGDTSRNTEGSGLGLSIANSLTELQGGKFHIYLDGDLFKITIGFEKMIENV